MELLASNFSLKHSSCCSFVRLDLIHSENLRSQEVGRFSNALNGSLLYSAQDNKLMLVSHKISIRREELEKKRSSMKELINHRAFWRGGSCHQSSAHLRMDDLLEAKVLV